MAADDSFWRDISILLGSTIVILGPIVFAGLSWYAFKRRKRTMEDGAKSYLKAKKERTLDPATLHPEIDPALCAGCGVCVDACPEGKILKLVGHKAVLVSATQCVGHGECELACPFDAISLVFGTKTRGMDLPRISTHYETNVEGLYIAGELGGMGLIRNAVKQGQLAARHAIETLGKASKAQVDLLIVGGGPAGLSACLEATANKVNYLCIEQGSLGGTVYNFPRQKVVMSQPAELPLYGVMKFPDNKVSKEQLLELWTEIRGKAKLRIKEGCKFMGLEKQGGAFKVKTSIGDLSAKKVILAMGVRGSPRKLKVPGEETPKVTYNLLDPEQYQKVNVAIVGGGNAAAEAVQNLARKQYGNKVFMLVRDKSMDRANSENRDLVNALVSEGRVTLHYETSVTEIHPKHLVVKQRDDVFEIPNDFIFIFAGAELPFNFLKSLGIQIDKKFGEALGS